MVCRQSKPIGLMDEQVAIEQPGKGGWALANESEDALSEDGEGLEGLCDISRVHLDHLAVQRGA